MLFLTTVFACHYICHEIHFHLSNVFFSESTNSTCCVMEHLKVTAKQKQKTLNGWFESWLKYGLSNYNVLHIFFGIQFKGVGNKHYSSAKTSLWQSSVCHKLVQKTNHRKNTLCVLGSPFFKDLILNIFKQCCEYIPCIAEWTCYKLK